MMLESIALYVGYAVMMIACATMVALLLIGCCKLWTRASWALVDAYGGIAVLREFRDWKLGQKEE